MQETYENIPGQSKITFLLQAIRNTAAAEEVCLNLLSSAVLQRNLEEEEAEGRHPWWSCGGK